MANNWSPSRHPRNPDGTFRTTGRGTQPTVRARAAKQAIDDLNSYIRDTGDVGTKREQRRDEERVAKWEQRRTEVRKPSVLAGLFTAIATRGQ